MNDEIKHPNIWVVENWWKHTGCYDREQASGFPYIRNGKKEPIGDYLAKTDVWWLTLTDDEKIKVYEEFFSED